MRWAWFEGKQAFGLCCGEFKSVLFLHEDRCLKKKNTGMTSSESIEIFLGKLHRTSFVLHEMIPNQYSGKLSQSSYEYGVFQCRDPIPLQSSTSSWPHSRKALYCPPILSDSSALSVVWVWSPEALKTPTSARGDITIQSCTRNWCSASDSRPRPPNPIPRIALGCAWSWFRASSFVFSCSGGCAGRDSLSPSLPLRWLRPILRQVTPKLN